ncbi:MAG: glycoside hydrolase domain-containing protein [Phycisphaerae bacterium]
MRSRLLAKYVCVLLVAAGVVGPARFLRAAWHVDLSNGGGGYWRTRVPVTVSRPNELPIHGVPIRLTVGSDPGQLPLAGFARKDVRVCDAEGVEYLWSVSPASGSNRDTLADGDVLSFAVDFADEASKVWYVYVENPDALPVEQFYGVTNGDFEEGGLWPYAWEVWKDSGAVADYLQDSGIGNSRCVHHSVRESGDQQFPCAHWEQHHVSAAPGVHYCVSGYVKVCCDSGVPPSPPSVTAGYYVDLYNASGTRVDRCEVLNSGECNWTRIDCEFDAPKDIAYMNIGTTFCASGPGCEAWYDGITVEVTNTPPLSLQITVGARERCELAPVLGDDAWNPNAPGNWMLRVDLRVRKFPPVLPCASGNPPMANGFTAGGASTDTTDWVLCDLREAINRIRPMAPAGATPPFRMVVVDPVTLATQTPVQVKELAVFSAAPQPGTEHRYYVYLSPEPEDPTAPGYGSLVGSAEHNLVGNPSFEGNSLVWGEPVPNNCDLPSVVQCGEVVDGGVLGTKCGRLTNENVDGALSWWGWTQNNIAIIPSSTYLFAGYMKTENVRDYGDLGGVTLYGHFNDRPDHTVVCFDAGHPLAGTTDWVLQTQVVTARADVTCADVHLTMCAHGTVWHDGILLARVERGQQVAIERAQDANASGDVSVWPVNPMVKVLPDDEPIQIGAQPVTISAARNEYEAFQLALRSKTPLQGVTVTVSALVLQNSPSNYWLPVDAFRIGTVPVDRPSGFYFATGSLWTRKTPHGDVVSDGWAGDWPDPLIPADPPGDSEAASLTFDLPAGRTQGLWFHVRVPHDAPAGQYGGSVVISAPDKDPISVPINLTVWDFTLPGTTSLQVIYDLDCLYHGNVPRGDDPPSVFRPWYDFLSGYRVSPGIIYPEPVFTYSEDKNGNLVVGISADSFLENARYCFDSLGVPVAFTPRFFFAAIWKQVLPLSFYRDVTIAYEDPRYDRALQAACKLFWQTVTKQGWQGKFVHYIADEPSCLDAPDVCSKLGHIADVVKSAVPLPLAFPVYASTWYHFPALDGHLTHWGAGQYGLFPLDDMKARLEAGDKLWFTTDGQDVIDTPYLAWERLTPTYAFRCRWPMPGGEIRGVSGYEYWGLAWWTHDPWRKGWHDFLWSYDGEKTVGVRYPNGDGYLCYPGEAINRSGPVPSIRLEAVREGIEDYEYYLMLEQLVGLRCAHDTPACRAARAALEAARNLVTIPTGPCSRSTEIMPDPDAIYRVRQQVAQAILSLRCAVPVVSGIMPNAGVQDSGNLPPHPPYGNPPPPGPVHVTITGANFTDGAVVRLTQAGKPDIVGTNVVVVDANTLAADFDLDGAAPGALDGSWDVVVTTCDAGTLPGAFAVAMCFSPRQDMDGDGDVDLADFTVLQACFNGPNRPASPAFDPRKCRCSDAQPAPDGDGDVDLADFTALQACFNGPNRPPACVQ